MQEKEKRFSLVQNNVKKILTRHPETRNDDFKLISRYLFEHCEDLPSDTNVFEALEYHTDYGIPIFESITRARRKIQADYPELSANSEVKDFREELENEFREEYRH